MKRFLRRYLLGLVAVLFVAVLAAGFALWRTLPPANATYRIPGLTAPVTVRLDRHGIPFIRAANAADAAAALGFLHARARLFQMLLLRRLITGRLAALIGPAGLPSDRVLRTLGLARHARETLAHLVPRTRALLEAYARGVNAWIAARGRFASLPSLWFGRPRPWEPVDSLYWGEWMAFDLATNWRTELQRYALSAHLPLKKIDQLWPAHHEAGDPAARPANRHEAAAAQRLLAVLPHFPAPFTLPSEASNAWAVAAARSATGAPLLAGDPHLGFGFPSLWYLARIETPHETLAGATAPGVPFLVLGRNRHLAWSFTDTEADTQDLFLETVLPDGEYLTPSGPRPFTVRHEIVRVRGARPLALTIRESRHGPVIALFDHGRKALALALASLAPGDTTATGLLALNRARTMAAVERAAPLISAPVLNLLAASRHHIGLFVTGRVPIRRSGDGSFPAPGASGAADWIGFASGAALPHYLDPATGLLVNANNRVAPADFPVFLGRDWPGAWRARRIRALLGRVPRQSLATMLAIQHDTVSLFARRILPALRAVVVAPGLPARARALLAGWNGKMDRRLPQPLIFNAWLRRFRHLVLAANHVPLADAGPARNDFTLFLLAPAGGRSWCGGDCHPLLARALAQSTAALARRYGPDPARWRWGRAHAAVFADPLLSRLPLAGGLARFAIAVSGDDTTIDRASPAAPGFTAVHGPEYRGVYDLAHPGRSRFIVAPGQSGNPLSAHAADLLRRWRAGGSLALGAAPKHLAGVLRLLP